LIFLTFEFSVCPNIANWCEHCLKFVYYRTTTPGAGAATDWNNGMRMKFNLVAFAATTFVVVAACAQNASAGTILSENFDELTPGLTVTSVGPFSAIGGTNVDIVYNTMGYGALCAGPESGNCVDLGGTGANGPSGNPNGILQSNTQYAAGQYLVSFDLVGSGRGQTDATDVSFGNYNKTFTLDSGDTTGGIVTDLLVTLATPGYLTFSEDPLGGNGNIGNLLDNVSIATADPASPVPEPFTLSLFGAGLAGAAALRRRKKAKA
jgi:hypothetical protein